MRFRFAAVLLFLALVPPAARAEDKLTRVPLEAKDIPAAHDEWYGFYMQGQKVGWMHAEFGKRGAVYAFVSSGEIHVRSMQQQVDTEFAEEKDFGAQAPFAFAGGRSKSRQGGASQETVVASGNDGFTATVTDAGGSRELPVGAVEMTLADALSAERWVAQGRREGDVARFRSFDFEELKADVDRLTVSKRGEALTQGVKTIWYEVQVFTEVKKAEATMRIDAKGNLLSLVMGGIFEARLEAEETAKKVEASSDLFVFGMAKIDKPVGAPKKVVKLVVRAEGEGAARLASGPRQKVDRDGAKGGVKVTLGADAGDPPAATEQEIAEALAETPAYPVRLPEVDALAKKAVGDAATPREKVEKLVHFVGAYIQDVLRPENVSVAEIIKSKKGDCTEHSLLFVTLARAAGIPARQASGLMYMGDGVKAFGGHAWDEVVLDGVWVPVDPTWDEVELDATHIALEHGTPSANFLAALGRLEFKLIVVETSK